MSRRYAPRGTEVVARANGRTPVHAIGRGESAGSSATNVVQQCVDRFTAEMRAADAPILSRVGGAEDESAFHRPHEEQHILLARGFSSTGRCDARFLSRRLRGPFSGGFSSPGNGFLAWSGRFTSGRSHAVPLLSWRYSYESNTANCALRVVRGHRLQL